MAEILVKAVDAVHADPTKDRRGCYKRGMPVVVMEDGHTWGAEERLPKFFTLKIPGVPAARVRQFLAPRMTVDQITGEAQPVRRRRWQFQWADFPAAARQKLAQSGALTIKVGAYAGAYDYTWAQVRAVLLDDVTQRRATAVDIG